MVQNGPTRSSMVQYGPERLKNYKIIKNGPKWYKDKKLKKYQVGHGLDLWSLFMVSFLDFNTISLKGLLAFPPEQASDGRKVYLLGAWQNSRNVIQHRTFQHFWLSWGPTSPAWRRNVSWLAVRAVREQRASKGCIRRKQRARRIYMGVEARSVTM